MKDKNPQETKEWKESLNYIIKNFGIYRAEFIIKQIIKNTSLYIGKKKNYINSPIYKTKKLFILEKKMELIIKWNAIAMVLKAMKKNPEIGGHLSTYASSSTLYEVGFNHFWKGNDKNMGDLIYIQGHSSPGIYSRSFIEGRLTEKNLNNFRRETYKNGISSYPHPYLMKNYWQFPTVSMGLGLIQSVYCAKFIEYMVDRKLLNNKFKNRKIWCMCGDGEMDEPEAMASIIIAGREKLNNLIFVVNCNLQRLDGLVRGNSNIIKELENLFFSNNWFVIKIIWNNEWDNLLKKDNKNLLKKRMNEPVDGEYQKYKANNIKYFKKHFFNNKELKNLISKYSDKKLEKLGYGGHDYNKVYSAYKTAINHKKKPVVILVKSVKGFGLGMPYESLNTVHNIKNIIKKNIIEIKNRLNIPISDKDAINLKFYKPDENSKELKNLFKNRKNLNGFIPKRREVADEYINIPDINIFNDFIEKKIPYKISTTLIMIKIISLLCKNNSFGKYIIPIVADEARTFGMEILFKQIKIYSKLGQLYKPVDNKDLIPYKESKNGQLLQEGINEAGAFCSWLIAATSYSINNKITIPFYMFYSMFGFQRIMDLIWIAADSMARGFLIGTIAGKTSLPGEGLQHCDGNSQIIASLVPNCISYDPTFSYELSVIIHYGMKKMFKEQKNVFFYITVYNEQHIHPNIKIDKNTYDNIINGIYCYKKSELKSKYEIELLGSGNILFEIINAAKILEKELNISTNIWSVTSFTELARNEKKLCKKKSILKNCFKNKKKPIIAITDYNKIYAEQIREFIKNKYITMGTDGFGISDTRKNLKSFFKLDKFHIIIKVLNILNIKKNKTYIKKLINKNDVK